MIFLEKSSTNVNEYFLARFCKNLEMQAPFKNFICDWQEFLSDQENFMASKLLKLFDIIIIKSNCKIPILRE